MFVHAIIIVILFVRVIFNSHIVWSLQNISTCHFSKMVCTESQKGHQKIIKSKFTHLLNYNNYALYASSSILFFAENTLKFNWNTTFKSKRCLFFCIKNIEIWKDFCRCRCRPFFHDIGADTATLITNNASKTKEKCFFARIHLSKISFSISFHIPFI